LSKDYAKKHNDQFSPDFGILHWYAGRHSIDDVNNHPFSSLKICQLLASFYIPKVDWLGAVFVLLRNFAGFLSRGTASSKME